GKANTSTSTVIELNGTETVVTSVALGTAVQDDATVTSNPPGNPLTIGGTVTYNFYSTATPVLGVTVPVFTDTEPVGTDSISTGPLTPGSYSFIAVYNGNSNFNSSTGPIKPPTGKKANTNTATVIEMNDTDTMGTSCTVGSR